LQITSTVVLGAMTSGHRSLVNVILLLAMFAVAHNAPMKVKRGNAGVTLSHKIQEFYCTSELLKRQVQTLEEVNTLHQ